MIEDNFTHTPFLVCTHPTGWCTHAGAVFEMRDCDGDGIPDPTCSDDSGQSGVIQSSKGCADSWPQGTCNPSNDFCFCPVIMANFYL